MRYHTTTIEKYRKADPCDRHRDTGNDPKSQFLTQHAPSEKRRDWCIHSKQNPCTTRPQSVEGCKEHGIAQEYAYDARQDERYCCGKGQLMPCSGGDHVDNQQATHKYLAHLIECERTEMTGRSSRNQTGKRPAYGGS